MFREATSRGNKSRRISVDACLHRLQKSSPVQFSAVVFVCSSSSSSSFPLSCSNRQTTAYLSPLTSTPLHHPVHRKRTHNQPQPSLPTPPRSDPIPCDPFHFPFPFLLQLTSHHLHYSRTVPTLLEELLVALRFTSDHIIFSSIGNRPLTSSSHRFHSCLLI